MAFPVERQADISQTILYCPYNGGGIPSFRPDTTNVHHQRQDPS